MININYLEIPITHSCSLKCNGCTAFSNYGLSNQVSLTDYTSWLKSWSLRIKPQHIRILGGEPFLVKDLPEFIRSTREVFPECTMQICTNGMNLNLHSDIHKVLLEYKCEIYMSVHSKDDKYFKRFLEAKDKLVSYADMGVMVGFGNNVDNWSRFYMGEHEDMTPYKSDPEIAHSVCHSKDCINIVDGKLWKCPQQANLHILNNKFRIKNYDKYMEFKGLDIGCSDEELSNLLEDKHQWYCEMCPEEPEHYVKSIYG